MVYVPSVYVPGQKKPDAAGGSAPNASSGGGGGGPYSQTSQAYPAATANASRQGYGQPAAPPASSDQPLGDFASALDKPSPPQSRYKTPTAYSNERVPNLKVNAASAPAHQHPQSQRYNVDPQVNFGAQAQQSYAQPQAYAQTQAYAYGGNPPAQNPTAPVVVTGQPVSHAYPTAIPGNMVGNSIPHAVTSTGYHQNEAVLNGGPTNGLVSQGNPVKCDKVDYEIKGAEMQLVEIELDPEETVIAESGALMFMEDGIDFKTKFGDGSNPKQGFFGKLAAAGGRILTGESLFLTHFKNKSSQRARVAFAAPFPGSIVPVDLQEIGEKIICQKDAFLCAAKGTKVALHFNKRIGSGLFGGEGFILQRLEGDGLVFIHGGGTIIRRELRGGRIRLDTGCLVAFTSGINFDITLAPGLKSILFGGEGLFLATLQGTGSVWMQSLPFSRMADRIIQSAPSAGGNRIGEGSNLTGKLGDFIDGDGGLGFGLNF